MTQNIIQIYKKVQILKYLYNLLIKKNILNKI